MRIRQIGVMVMCCAATQALANEQQPWDEVTLAIGAVKEMPAGLQNHEELERLRNIGRALFSAKFTTNDGAGRPMATQAIIPTKTKRPLRREFARTSGPDAAACAACHNEPFLGGAGDFAANVFVAEGFNNHDFDTTDPEFSNERGSNHLFGSGLIELLAREMTQDLRGIRAAALKQARVSGQSQSAELTSKGVDFGLITAFPDGLLDLSKVDGVDDDLVVRPFSQKGVMTSLRQFTINALNHHHGMQPVERWGARWTDEIDFDEDGVVNEVSASDVSALVAWQAALPAPEQVEPEGFAWQKNAIIGQRVFGEIGCAGCHRPNLPLRSLVFTDPGPLDAAGTLRQTDVADPASYDLGQLEWVKLLPRNDKGEVLVPLFGDLKRHRIADAQVAQLGNELFSQRFVGRDVFMTAELWGLASTAPYGHRNDMTTLDQVIMAHGGDARSSRDAYANSTSEQKSSIIAFLKTLVIKAEE